MRLKSFALLPFILICVSACSYAQAWSGIISSSRAVDWSKAGAGLIPNRTTLCGATIAAYTGTADTINNAIAACGSGGVVQLGAGTFNLSTGILFNNHSQVTLRGSGADQTFLVFTGSNSCGGLGADICVFDGAGLGPGSGIPSNQTANWTAGYATGTTQITLSNTNLLQPGTVLVLDQLDDSSDNGTIYECQTTNVCGNDQPSGAGRSGRGQEQFVRVVAVSGSTVTITPGIYMPNWRSSQSPQAWWAGALPVSGDGIENLSMDHTASTGAASGVYFFNAYGCWLRNVRSLNSRQNHVWLYQSAHITVSNSYFFGTQNAATNSYGVESYMAGDNLIENNIFQHISSPTVSSGTSGNVFAYNYSVDDFTTFTGWMMAAQWLHAVGDDLLLWESNQGTGFIADNVHGTHHFGTLFRNQFTGFEATKSQQTIPIHLYTHSRYFNLVGNVLGASGYHTNYTDCYGNSPCITTPDSKGDVSIYTLGWCGNEGTNTPGVNGCGSSMVADANTPATLMRWGNYDTVNGAARFVGSEVPSGLSQFSNPVPANQTLPASFYLSAKPSWWATVPWPAIGPDVTGGTGPGGLAYAIPAQLCYNNTSKDINGILLFKASACYPGLAGTPPMPPTNVRAVLK